MLPTATILQGDALTKLCELPDESVHCCVTSPPYWSLRDYSCAGQLGLEKTPEEYVAKMVEVFREVRRVLRKDGTLWMNLGDSYNANQGAGFDTNQDGGSRKAEAASPRIKWGKPKDLCGIPWRLAFALQADGWWLRSDIIWHKPNPMPESCTDRPTKSHEYLFLLTKSARYFYDAEAIKEGVTGNAHAQGNGYGVKMDIPGSGNRANSSAKAAMHNPTTADLPSSRNKRSVWTVATAPYPEAHFATYPPDLIKPCIMAGTSAKGCCAKCGSPWERKQEFGEAVPLTPSDSGRKSTWTIGDANRDPATRTDTPLPRHYRPILSELWQPTCECESEKVIEGFKYPVPDYPTIPCTVIDPFAGSGTTGQVALELGRKAILIELNPKYVELINHRCCVTPGLALN